MALITQVEQMSYQSRAIPMLSSSFGDKSNTGNTYILQWRHSNDLDLALCRTIRSSKLFPHRYMSPIES